MSESYARAICGWTGKLPVECRADADAILVTAAGAGMDLRDLTALGAEIYARSLPDAPDQDKDGAFEDRSVRLETTFGGAGVLGGDLTPECAAVVSAVLDALSAPAARRTPGPARSGTTTGCRRRCAAWSRRGCCRSGPGSQVKAWVHVSLADLMVLEGSSALLEEWTAGVRAAHGPGTGRPGRRAEGDGGAWLDGAAAAAMTCDAAMAPVVTGDVDPAALEDLIRLCVQLNRVRRHPGDTGRDSGGTGGGGTGIGTGDSDTGTGTGPVAPGPDTARAWAALEQAVIGKITNLLLRS